MNAVMKYPGAKWALAEWIIAHFPPHHSYLEPFEKKIIMIEPLKPGDPCPCFGMPILTDDPKRLLLLIRLGRMLDADRKSRPEPGAAGQS